MNDQELRTKIYTSFDTIGIRVKPIARINININSFVNDSKDIRPEFILEPIFENLDISTIELEDYIFHYIYDTTGLRIESINDLKTKPTINGLPFILMLNEWSRENMSFYLAFGKIPGSVTFREFHNIISLGNIEHVCGDLGFSQTEIQNLGKLKRVDGSLWIGQTLGPYTQLKELGDLKYVGGDLNIKNSPILSLSNLEYVGGTLNLRKTNIVDLGNLQYVGNHLYLPKKMKSVFDLSKIKIEGKVKYFSE